MQYWYELESKQPIGNVISEWYSGLKWGKEEARTLPIQSIRLMDDKDKTLFSSTAKGNEDWQEATGLLELCEHLEDELGADLNPQQRMLKLRVSPVADEREKVKQKTFTVINLAMMKGRSLRPEEVGAAPPADLQVGGVESQFKLVKAVSGLVPQGQGATVQVNVNELITTMAMIYGEAYKPVYQLVDLTVAAVDKVMKLHATVTQFAQSNLADHPQLARLHYEHELALRKAELESQTGLERVKEEGKAKVLAHTVQTIGGTPEGMSTLLELLGKINKLLP